jgi:DNA polymerase III delta subunit
MARPETLLNQLQGGWMYAIGCSDLYHQHELSLALPRSTNTETEVYRYDVAQLDEALEKASNANLWQNRQWIWIFMPMDTHSELTTEDWQKIQFYLQHPQRQSTVILWSKKAKTPPKDLSLRCFQSITITLPQGVEWLSWIERTMKRHEKTLSPECTKKLLHYCGENGWALYQACQTIALFLGDISHCSNWESIACLFPEEHQTLPIWYWTSEVGCSDIGQQYLAIEKLCARQVHPLVSLSLLTNQLQRLLRIKHNVSHTPPSKKQMAQANAFTYAGLVRALRRIGHVEIQCKRHPEAAKLHLMLCLEYIDRIKQQDYKPENDADAFFDETFTCA